MEKQIKETIIDILDSISVIEESIQGIGFEDYRTDRKRMIQVVGHFGTIIEKAAMLPESFRDQYPDIPWVDINNLVNRFIRSDFGIDEQVVWKAAKIELRHLRKLFDDVFFNRERAHVF